MDWGCKFFTPKNIANFVSKKACHTDLVVDLFSGSGCLYQPITKISNKEISILAMDVDPLVHSSNDSDDIKFVEGDCLNPKNIKKALSFFSKKTMTVILNPPFHDVKAKEEISYWKEISKISPVKLTHRIECLALMSALEAVSTGTQIIAIIPDTLIRSERKAFFFDALKKYYSFKVLKKFKRERFGGAEVDVAIISIIKSMEGDIVTNINTMIKAKKIMRKNRKYPFQLFRGSIRSPQNRHLQTSVKHLQVGGIDINGVLSSNEMEEDTCKASEKGDILIARVGVRTVGRVGKVVSGTAYTNESVLSLRIQGYEDREKIYKALTSDLFTRWIKKEAKGTSNYFIPTEKLKKWITVQLFKPA